MGTGGEVLTSIYVTSYHAGYINYEDQVVSDQQQDIIIYLALPLETISIVGPMGCN